MEIKKDGENQGTKEDILRYLLWYGKENKFRLARVFKVGTEEVIAALSALENEGKIEMKGSKAKPITKLTTKSRRKELERGAENVEEVAAPEEADKEAEESEKGVEQWLADMR